MKIIIITIMTCTCVMVQLFRAQGVVLLIEKTHLSIASCLIGVMYCFTRNI